jgi:hypothetical protein
VVTFTSDLALKDMLVDREAGHDKNMILGENPQEDLRHHLKALTVRDMLRSSTIGKTTKHRYEELTPTQ